MTMTRGRDRATVVIPAQGMIEFRDTLTDLFVEFGCEDLGGRYHHKRTADGMDSLCSLCLVFGTFHIYIHRFIFSKC